MASLNFYVRHLEAFFLVVDGKLTTNMFRLEESRPYLYVFVCFKVSFLLNENRRTDMGPKNEWVTEWASDCMNEWMNESLIVITRFQNKLELFYVRIQMLLYLTMIFDCCRCRCWNRDRVGGGSAATVIFDQLAAGWLVNKLRAWGFHWIACSSSGWWRWWWRFEIAVTAAGTYYLCTSTLNGL